MAKILEGVTDGFATYDRKWHITFVNQRAAEIVGKTPEELLGKNLWDVYPDAVGSIFYKEFHRAIAEATSVHFQEFYAPLNLWLEVHAYPSQEGLAVLFQDITERKQAEEALQSAYGELENQVLKQTVELKQAVTQLKLQKAERQQAEEALRKTNEQLANILESITDGFCALDRQWCYTYVNQKAEQILQKNQTELLGKNIWEVYPQAVSLTLYKKFHEAFQRGVPLQFEMFCPSLNLWFENHVYPSQDGLSIYFQDITARKQIEAEREQFLMREQEARARAEMAEQRCAFLAEASAVLASSLDYKTTLKSVAQLVVPFLADYCLIHKLGSDRQLRLVAAIHQDPQKQDLLAEFAAVYQTHIQDLNSFAARVVRTKEPMLVSEASPRMLQSLTQDPRLLDLYARLDPKSFMILPLAARGQIFGTLVLATAESNRRYDHSDLSLALDLARRAAMAIDNADLYHKAQESNRLKDEFLATLSHELRTPLNGILGWAKILLTRRLDERTIRQAVETIERKAKAQVQIVYDLLDMSRLSLGKLHLNSDWVELSLVINEAIDSLSLAAEAKSIQLHSHCDSSVEAVQGDAERLRQVVWNLLSNAIKFTPKGGRVDIQLKRVANDALIQVSDTGVGIKTKFLPYVFDRFRQADSTTTRLYEGLGLGLALVRHLVELHGGTVQAFSEGEGKGATFTVKLPLFLGSSDTTNYSLVRTPDSLLTGLRLLVVDDEPDSREVITFILKEYGADVTAVASVNEAVKAVERLSPDIFISDMGMADLDGYSLLNRVRVLEAEQDKQIPAIALTAYTGDEERTRVLSTGFQMYISKPVEPVKLAAAVARLAGRRCE